MILVIDKLDSSTIPEEPGIDEVESVDVLFDIRDYKSGTVIAKSEDLSILAHGDIKVKVQSSVGESTIQILKPGDILDLGNMAGRPVSGNGAPSQTETTLYAVGDTKVLSADRVELEKLSKFQPGNLHCVIQGMAQSAYDILHSLNYQNAELRNYFYRINGLY